MELLKTKIVNNVEYKIYQYYDKSYRVNFIHSWNNFDMETNIRISEKGCNISNGGFGLAELFYKELILKD